MLVSACGDDQVSWTEEVKLHDGKVVQVKRRIELTGSGFPVEKRGFQKYQEFCYAPLGIHWKSKAEYTPEVFDIVDGKAYSKVTLGSDCTRCMLHGYPATDALYFRWDGNAWKEIPSSEYPARLLRLNLLMNTVGKEAAGDPHGLVSLDQKRSRDVSLQYELEKTGAHGLNELADYRGSCNKCKTINVKTDRTADVFPKHQDGGQPACI